MTTIEQLATDNGLTIVVRGTQYARLMLGEIYEQQKDWKAAEAVYSDVWAPDPACYLTDGEIGL